MEDAHLNYSLVKGYLHLGCSVILIILGKKFTIIKSPKPGENNLSLEVLLEPEKNGTAKFLVSHIEIEGGDCDKWKSAF
jgi:hypothetical protein